MRFILAITETLNTRVYHRSQEFIPSQFDCIHIIDLYLSNYVNKYSSLNSDLHISFCTWHQEAPEYKDPNKCSDAIIMHSMSRSQKKIHLIFSLDGGKHFFFDSFVIKLEHCGICIKMQYKLFHVALKIAAMVIATTNLTDMETRVTWIQGI